MNLLIDRDVKEQTTLKSEAKDTLRTKAPEQCKGLAIQSQHFFY